MGKRKLETQIKVSGEDEDVEAVVDRICEIFNCRVSRTRKSDGGGCHIFLSVRGVNE